MLGHCMHGNEQENLKGDCHYYQMQDNYVPGLQLTQHHGDREGLSYEHLSQQLQSTENRPKYVL